MKKKGVYTMLLVSIMMVFVSCTNSTKKVSAGQTAEDLTVAEFKSKVDADPTGQIIDVRTPEEQVESGLIPNATLINIHDADFKDNIGKLDKTKPVYVYCKSGGRSGKAMNVMVELGFKEIYNLDGGITAWNGANYPTDKRVP